VSVRRHATCCPTRRSSDLFTDSRRASESDFLNEWTGSKQITYNTSSTIKTLYDMMREACLMSQFNKTNSRQRRCFGRFHNKSTTCSKCRRSLSRHHCRREIPPRTGSEQCRSSFSGHHCSWEIPRRDSSNQSNRLFSDCQTFTLCV